MSTVQVPQVARPDLGQSNCSNNYVQQVHTTSGPPHGGHPSIKLIEVFLQY